MRLAVVALFLVATQLGAATITVTTTADAVLDGDGCSLREAIMAANSDAAINDCASGSGSDSIAFNIPASELQDIVLLSDLPEISTPLTIDGRSQPGTTCPFQTTVSITGDPNVTETVFRFVAGSDNSAVYGLRIHSMFQSGITTAFGTAFRIESVDGFALACNTVGFDRYGSPEGRMARILVADSVSNLRLGGRGGGWYDNSFSNLFAGILGIRVSDSSDVDIAGNWIGAAPQFITVDNIPSRGISVHRSVRVHIGVRRDQPNSLGGNVLASGALLVTDTEDLTVYGNRIGVYPDARAQPFGANFAIQIADLTGQSHIGHWDPAAGSHSHLANIILNSGGCLGSIFGWAGCGIDIRSQLSDGISVQGNLFLGPELVNQNALHQGIHAGDHTENVLLANNAFMRWPGALTLHDFTDSVSFAPGSGNNCFEGNQPAIWNPYALQASLPNNWWGSPDGPSGAGPGSGDPVDDGVEFEPFLTERPQSCALLQLAPRAPIAIPVLSPIAFLILVALIGGFALMMWARRST